MVTNVTRVIFVRHGEAEGNVERYFHGHYDSDLTENGYKQVMLTAERLKSEPMDIIYSSDLKRTMETAKPIAQMHNLTIITDRDLREIYGGDWENVRWDELPERYPESYDNWLHNPQLLVMPNGESMVDFQKRLLDAVRRIVCANVGKNICIVTHGTAIKTMLCEYKGKSLSDFPDLMWHDNASYTVVDFDKDMKATIVVEGENSQLGNLSTLAKQNWWRKNLIEGEE